MRVLNVEFTGSYVYTCNVLQVRDNGSMDIKVTDGNIVHFGLKPYHAYSFRFLNLAPNGIVGHFSRESWGQHDKVIYWDNNVPTWKILYYKEANDVAFAFLIIWQREKRSTFNNIARDIAVMIAKMIHGSFRDTIWESVHCTDTSSVPSTLLRSNS